MDERAMGAGPGAESRVISGYVLAGGRSSRMGTDKAELRLGGRTLLEIAVGKLRRVCREVIVVGQRPVAPEGVRVIADRWTGCGPMGGMEAALADAGALAGAGEGSALFFPVDMPLIPRAVVEGLAGVWRSSEAGVCLPVTDGVVQPLLCQLRAEVLPEVREALGRGAFKVRPLLEAAGVGRGGVLRTTISTADRGSVWPGWMPSEAEWALRELWFSNLNTPEEFARAEGWAGALPLL